MGNKIIVIGSANADVVIHAPRMPKLGETIAGDNFQINAGGKGLNQAIAVAKLGGNPAFIGCIGADTNGDMLVSQLGENGVAFAGFRTEDVPTGTAMITVIDGDNFIILDAGANGKLTPEAVAQYTTMITESDFCVMQLEIPLETILEVCRIAKKGGTKIILNPAPSKKLPEELFTFVDYLIPNEYEAEDITGICLDTQDGCRKAVKSLRQMGVKNVIITLGDRGCVYNSGEDIIFVPAEETTVVDTTSAGDCFIGAVVSKLFQGASLDDAVAFATRASAITVSRTGASKSIPWACEI